MRTVGASLSFLLVGCSAASSPASRPEATACTPSELAFTGNTAYTADELRARMAPIALDTEPAVEKTPPPPAVQLERGLLQLYAAYYDRGYVEVRMEQRVQANAQDRCDVHVAIVEGPRYRVASLRVFEVDASAERTAAPSPTEALATGLTARTVGSWFSRAALAERFEEIRRAYRDGGYDAIELEPEARFDRERHLVEIVVPIRRGPKT